MGDIEEAARLPSKLLCPLVLLVVSGLTGEEKDGARRKVSRAAVSVGE